MSETAQSIGALTNVICARETSWGVVNGSPTWRALRLLGGLQLQPGIQIYASREIRPDRMSNRDVLGTQRPFGTVPFELSPQGWNNFFYDLLGGTVTTTGAGPYTHVLKGSVALPVGFTMEQQHLDQSGGDNPYYGFLGGRVDTVDLSMNIDQVVTGTMAALFREAMAPAGSSMNSGSAPTAPTDDPYTSTQVAVYEGSSLTLLGIAEQANLRISNGLTNFRDRGFILGTNLAANLKPGTRSVTGSLRLKFQNSSFVTKAKTAASTKLRFLMSNGTYSAQFDIGTAEILPVDGSWPSIADDGPISINVNFKAQKDTTNGTDIKATLIVPESSIIT